MKNKLIDLNNHLFEQLERLSDEELDLETEMKRTKAITDVAHAIIDNATLALQAEKYFNDVDFTQKSTPSIFKIEENNEKVQQRDC